MSSWDILSGNLDRDNRNVRVLMESVAELYGPRGLEELPQRAVDRAILITHAERGILLIDEGDGLEPQVARDKDRRDLPLDLRFSQSVVEQVWESGEPFRTFDAPEAKARSLTASMVDLRLLSVMATPLVVQGQRLGILYVDSTAHVREFDESDFMVFNALGGLIALAVDRQRKEHMERQLLAERLDRERMERQLLAERLEKERIEHQIGMAHDVQRRLLPANLTPPAGFDMWGEGRPCESLSGDYFDVIHLKDGRIALVVGDVSGHGIGPALYMASTRALIQSQLGDGAEALKVVATLNNFLARDMSDNEFMSLFLGILDPARREIVYGSAGHNPPILVRASGGVEELACTGPVLSVFEDAPYRISDPIRLEAGDAIVLYTDGIYEAHRSPEEMYGEERFRASLERHVRAGRSAKDIIGGVLSDLDAFRGGTPLEDDITCLAVRVL